MDIKIYQDVGTVAVGLHHFADTADLALDAAQAVQEILVFFLGTLFGFVAATAAFFFFCLHAFCVLSHVFFHLLTPYSFPVSRSLYTPMGYFARPNFMFFQIYFINKILSTKKQPYPLIRLLCLLLIF